MKKIAIIIKSYGEEFLWGGAEYLCYHFVKHMSECFDIDILTTSSSDKNKDSEHVHIIRLDINKESDDSICNYLDIHQYDYSVVFLMKRDIDILSHVHNFHNVCFVPFAHETPSLVTEEVKRIVSMSPAVLFNTPEEKELMQTHFDISNKYQEIGLWALESSFQTEHLQTHSDFPSSYIVYVGRISDDKNYRQLNEYFIHYKRHYPSDLKLVVIGKIQDEMLMIHSDDIIYTGFIPEGQKNSLIKNAKLLVLPSLQESLSIVILESMRLGTPVLVNSTCPVLAKQCERSGSGLYYKNFTEFSAALSFMLSSPSIYDELKHNGVVFTQKTYAWDRILERLTAFINAISENKPYTSSDFFPYEPTINVVKLMDNIKHTILSKDHATPYPSLDEIRHRYFLNNSKSQSSIVIVGSGIRGRSMCQYLLENNCHVVCTTDHNADQIGNICGIPTLTIDESIRNYPDAYYIITPQNYKYELFDELYSKGIAPEQIDYGIPLW